MEVASLVYFKRCNEISRWAHHFEPIILFVLIQDVIYAAALAECSSTVSDSTYSKHARRFNILTNKRWFSPVAGGSQ